MRNEIVKLDLLINFIHLLESNKNRKEEENLKEKEQEKQKEKDDLNDIKRYLTG